MRGSSGPESSSPTLVEIRASIRCSSGFLIAARICSLWEKNQNTSITATTAPRNIVMVINQIICALALSPTTVPSLLQEGPSFTELNCTSVIGRSKNNSIPCSTAEGRDPGCAETRIDCTFTKLAPILQPANFPRQQEYMPFPLTTPYPYPNNPTPNGNWPNPNQHRRGHV